VAITRGIEKVVCIHPLDAQLKRNISRNAGKVPPGMLRASRFLYEANLGLSIGLGDSILARENGKGLSADEVLIAEKYLSALGLQTGLVEEKAEVVSASKSAAGKKPQTIQALGISDITEGLMVFHPSFGAGTVTAIKDRKQGRITVLFEDHGEMVLLASYARLEALAS
jgi:hypothetical protein